MTEAQTATFGLPGLLWRLATRSPLKLFAMLGLLAIVSFLLSGALLFKGGVEMATAKGMGRLGADLMVVPKGVDVPLQKGLFGGVPASFSLPRGLEEQIAVIPGVERTAPQYFLSSAQASCCETGNLLIIGFDDKKDFTIIPWTKGPAVRNVGENGVLVGGAVMKAPGATLRFYNHTFTVAEMLEKTGMGYFDNSAFIPLDEVARMEVSSRSPGAVPLDVPWGRPSVVLLKLSHSARPDEVAAQIQRLSPEAKILTISELFWKSKQRMSHMSRLLVPVVLTAWVVAIAITLSAQILYWSGRKQNLGLLQALGMSRPAIAMFFAGEALILATAGMAAGALAAFGSLRMFAPYINVVEGLPFLLDFTVIAAGNVHQMLGVFMTTALVQTLIIIGWMLRKEPYVLIRGEG